ncbi:hypothetical protein [Paraeggerthella sp. Marseille-Q4926]|uniref:hypothetical protein n=1 Tax=Paraeggerthella sp. Marseille-Q4926 TaxID=2866587 RepID=UPI001CE4654E|nr:hypothetical protein [Paraeggerthella sp. Marseille-Q4926]
MLDVDVKIGGIDAVSAALRGAQPEVRRATVPVMEMAARSIASRATSIANPSSPHNLWRGSRGASLRPRYAADRRGPYWFRVETPGGNVGKAEAIAEFSRLAVTPQGGALVSALTSAHGRPGGAGNGRILWRAADGMSDDVYSSVRRAVDAAAASIEGKMGGA